MSDWPLEIDGRQFQPIPESWIEHGDDHDTGRPRVYAVSAAHPGRGRLFVRYVHPRDHGVFVATMEGTEHNDGIVPELLADADGSWPRSLVPTRDLEPDIARSGEIEYLRELWRGRIEAPASGGGEVDV